MEAARRRCKKTPGTMTAAVNGKAVVADGFMGGKLRGGSGSCTTGRRRHPRRWVVGGSSEERQPRSSVDDAGIAACAVVGENGEDDGLEARWERDTGMCVGYF